MDAAIEAPAAPPARRHDEVIIRADGSGTPYWKDVWRHRELLYFLLWRDFILRYKQTLIGVSWAVVRPLATTVVMVIVFGKLAGLGFPGIPYTLVVLTGLLGWQLFAAALTNASSSVVGNSSLVMKIYFPRLIIPGSALLGCLVDYLISCGLLAAMMLYFGFNPGRRAIVLPALTALTVLCAAGPGLWFAALNVRYRDVNNVLGILLQVGVYISPVAFSSSLVAPEWRLLYSLNPMAGIIDGYRWALLRQDAAVYLPGFCASMAVMLALLVSGAWYFRKTESAFADVI